MQYTAFTSVDGENVCRFPADFPAAYEPNSKSSRRKFAVLINDFLLQSLFYLSRSSDKVQPTIYSFFEQT